MHAGTCVETGSNGGDGAQSSPPASVGGANSTRALQEEDLFTPRRALQETPASSASMGGPQYYKLEEQVCSDGVCTSKCSGDSTTEQMPLPQELWTTQDYCSDGVPAGRTVEQLSLIHI